MEVAVGDWVQAQDRRGHWYDARIVAERGTGESREVKVHYHRWKSRHDEWLAASGPRVLGEDADLPACPSYRWTAKPGKVHGADDQYIAEKLLKVRGEGTVREFLVRWKGYTKDDDSWEPEEHIEQSLIDDFENPAPRTKLARRNAPKIPYTLQQPDVITPEIADLLSVEWTHDVGRKAAALLAHQREEFGGRKITTISPCPAWLYKALHRAFRLMADECEGVRSLS